VIKIGIGRLGADRYRGVRVHVDEHLEEGPSPAQPRLHSGALPLDLFLGDVARRKPVACSAPRCS